MSRLAGVGAVLKREFLKMLPIAIYFLVGFNLIAFSLHLALQQHGIVYNGITAATFGALIVAKVVLIADAFPAMRLFRGRPLFRPILYRTIIYTIAVLAAHVLEQVVHAAIDAGSLADGITAFNAAFVWEHGAFIAIWVFVLFLVYVTFAELHEEFGQGGLMKTIFSRG